MLSTIYRYMFKATSALNYGTFGVAVSNKKIKVKTANY